MRGPSNLPVKLPVEIPKCYPLGVMVTHGDPLRGTENQLRIISFCDWIKLMWNYQSPTLLPEANINPPQRTIIS